MALIKVRASDRTARDEVIQMVNIFRGNIIDVSRESLTIGIFGKERKIAALIDMLKDFGILEIAKTGAISIQRGPSTIYDMDKLKTEYEYGKNVL
jgi:acetolactate synthase-1/3 small subunit